MIQKRGRGGVTLRPDGRFVARIQIDGKRHVKYTRTEREGHKWLAKMRGEPYEVRLTPAETAVLSCIAKGYTNDEVSAALDISIQTVKTHARAICRNLRVGNITQAVVWFINTMPVEVVK